MVYGQRSPTLSHFIPRIFQKSRSTESKKKAALARISIASRQAITNNDRDNTINSNQRLTADQIALRTELRRDYYALSSSGIYTLQQGMTSHGILLKNPDHGSYERYGHNS
ncbi:hypothetical protein AVEN_148299-1 [Araneus ventricosus]|uniref:Uncharacterized protein n=1 Tax=Araneus ventricosus TaxID=182803 RepID=A0A4Y2FUT9_ARAVE|nr:hypothetical protein AVEN_148299-1 [Araneus ventricosus]